MNTSPNTSAPPPQRLPVGSEILPGRRPRPARSAPSEAQVSPSRRPPAPPTPPEPKPASDAPEAALPLRKDFQPPRAGRDKPTFLKRLELPAIILFGMVGGILVQSAPIGQLLICIYGVVALLLRLESRNTFILTLLSLATTIAVVISSPGSPLAQTFAGYTLLLLLIGVICAARETREQKHLLTKKRGAARRY